MGCDRASHSYPMHMSQSGQAAASFTLPDHEGIPQRLEDYAGRWLLMVFHRHLA
jgi:peroxiredoxin